MTAAVLLALVAVGLSAGLLAGLVGIGGGVLMVPFLYFFYDTPSWSGFVAPPELHAALAHATSLLIIVPIAIQATLSYHRARLVQWRAVLPIVGPALLAGVLGARLAVALPVEILKLAFGLFVLASGAQLLWMRPETRAPRQPRTRLVWAMLTGLLVGSFSAVLGVGGGLVAIPLLLHVTRIELRQVAATSIAIVAFAAPAYPATYIVSGWGRPELPPGSLGYVHLAVALPMMLGALLSVRAGVWLNQRVQTRVLRWVFGVMLVALGLRLIVQSAGVL